jgi:hypothetical protein
LGSLDLGGVSGRSGSRLQFCLLMPGCLVMGFWVVLMAGRVVSRIIRGWYSLHNMWDHYWQRWQSDGILGAGFLFGIPFRGCRGIGRCARLAV